MSLSLSLSLSNINIKSTKFKVLNLVKIKFERLEKVSCIVLIIVYSLFELKTSSLYEILQM
ncbi:hypothetical protein FACS1894155_07170 [Bacteroidia bacterium]|nr:hypothetical protein FACS1894155_07170 [Bacteroidia bacterium]